MKRDKSDNSGWEILIPLFQFSLQQYRLWDKIYWDDLLKNFWQSSIHLLVSRDAAVQGVEV